MSRKNLDYIIAAERLNPPKGHPLSSSSGRAGKLIEGAVVVLAIVGVLWLVVFVVLGAVNLVR